MNRCDHDWRQDWTDGKIGRIECTKCQKGLLVTVGTIEWRFSKAPERKA